MGVERETRRIVNITSLYLMHEVEPVFVKLIVSSESFKNFILNSVT